MFRLIIALSILLLSASGCSIARAVHSAQDPLSSYRRHRAAQVAWNTRLQAYTAYCGKVPNADFTQGWKTGYFDAASHDCASPRGIQPQVLATQDAQKSTSWLQGWDLGVLASMNDGACSCSIPEFGNRQLGNGEYGNEQGVIETEDFPGVVKTTPGSGSVPHRADDSPSDISIPQPGNVSPAPSRLPTEVPSKPIPSKDPRAKTPSQKVEQLPSKTRPKPEPRQNKTRSDEEPPAPTSPSPTKKPSLPKIDPAPQAEETAQPPETEPVPTPRRNVPPTPRRTEVPPVQDSTGEEPESEDKTADSPESSMTEEESPADTPDATPETGDSDEAPDFGSMEEEDSAVETESDQPDFGSEETSDDSLEFMDDLLPPNPDKLKPRMVPLDRSSQRKPRNFKPTSGTLLNIAEANSARKLSGTQKTVHLDTPSQTNELRLVRDESSSNVVAAERKHRRAREGNTAPRNHSNTPAVRRASPADQQSRAKKAKPATEAELLQSLGQTIRTE